MLAQIGFTLDKEAVLASDGITDHWQVVGQRQEDDGQMRTQRTWLHGVESQRYALLLDFAVQNQPMALRPAVGQGLVGEMVFYPATVPLRALVKENPPPTPPFAKEGSRASPFAKGGLRGIFFSYSQALTANPWLGLFPFAIANAIPVRHDTQWLLVDAAQHAVPLRIYDEQAWILLAESGGHPLDIFGEWDGHALQVCGTFQAKRGV